MGFKSIQLAQFRNYPVLNLDLEAGINCITGKNGEGKTNFLESIHYLAMARGFHSRSDQYTVQSGQGYFQIRSVFAFDEV